MTAQPWYRLILPAGRPLRWVLPAVALVGLLLLQTLIPAWAARPEAWTVDARFLLRGARDPQHNIIIVALDEGSFQMLGGLDGENIRTWPRARWAELVTRIASGDPDIIGLDVDFDTPAWDAGGDEALAQAIEQAGNVVLASHFKETTVVPGTTRPLGEPLPMLGDAARETGLTAFSPDADGGIRRISPLLFPWGDQNHPAFSLAVASIHARSPIDVQNEHLRTGIPINFRGPERTFQTLPLYTVLGDDLVASGFIWEDEVTDPETFRGAIVLVGYTTLLEQDRHLTPFGGEEGLPGVEIQANAIDTLLIGDWLRRPPTWAPLALVAAAGLIALIALNLPRPGLGVLALLAAVALYAALGFTLFSARDVLLPLVAPAAAALTVGGTALAERMVFAERDKRRLRRRFAGVMSPERLRAVLDNWEALLEPERPQKEAAVLFADVRGFTRTTEALMHQGRSPEMVRFLTAYLDAMSEAVFAEGGVVYDVVGDGLMILFGVPEPFPDYALRAARAATRMALASEGLQAVWPLRDESPFQMGIGVHCGAVVDAIVGRGRRVEYSVIGDPVNTAARIEAHCKVAMDVPRPPGGQVPRTVTILLSADLTEKIRDHVLVDESVPPFEARGKAAPLRVVRLLGLRDGAP